MALLKELAHIPIWDFAETVIQGEVNERSLEWSLNQPKLKYRVFQVMVS